MIFSATNLTSQALAPCAPWEFKPSEELTAQLRGDKQERQKWYHNINTRHSFYTLVEAANPNQRVSREDNPPRLLHGVVADYEMPIDPPALAAALAAMQIKPAWAEKSLGGNLHLVWLFPRPLPVESYELCTALLQASREWLKLDLLPSLDAPALENPTRLYANGCDWTETGFGPISEDALQVFFVETGRQFRFTTKDGVEIPLEAVEKALKEKFPHFSWPTEFSLESKGPSFWIPGSVSSSSAIVKTEGMFTFSAHADKPFYTWADILGAEFVQQFTVASISKATSDIWYDGKKFYRKKKGAYVGMEQAELINHLKVTCGINAKGGKLEQTLAHIYSENFVDSVGPFIFRPSGLIEFQGKRKLNTSDARVMPPAADKQTWGPHGNFPFLSALFENLFTTQAQLDHFLAWWQYFYLSGMNLQPMPGQAVFILGGVGVGKTFCGREIVGKSVGGFCDASGWILRGGEFNSHIFENALLVLDDETVGESPNAAYNLQAMLKKCVANSSFLSNRKFAVAGMIEWMGRVFATSNLDYMSSRILGPIDSSALGKISVYRAEKISKLKFPARTEIEKFRNEQIAFLLRWLVDWTPPDHVERDSRFGYVSYHDASLMQQAEQTSKAGPFREVLVETLEEYFKDNPKATCWRGTVSKLLQQLHMNPMRDVVIKTLRLEQVSRHLENIEKDGILPCRVETGSLNSRIWIFDRFGDTTAAAPAIPENGASIFSK